MKKLAKSTATPIDSANEKSFLSVVTDNPDTQSGETTASAEQGNDGAGDTAPQGIIIPSAPVPFELREEAIEALHRKTVKLNRVKEDALKLKEFEIDLKEEPENTETEYFTACSFSINDDQGHRYAVKNPRLVSACVALLKGMYQDKIAELENEIVWPY